MRASTLRAAIFGVILALSFFVTTAAFAQVEGVQVSPAVLEDRSEPGKTYTFNIRVTNVSDGERTFFLLARDIVGLDAGGVPMFSEEGEKTPYELSSWIQLPMTEVTLKKGESRTISFTVQVPADASPGSHFGGVFFEARPDQLSGTGAAVGARVGTLLNLRIAGDVMEDMRLREFSTANFIYSAPPVEFLTRIDNLGNVLLRPQGQLEISDMFGKQVASIPMADSGAGVFPAGNRDYKTIWEHEGFTFGRYQAVLSVVYGEDGRKTLVRTTSFWILPLKLTSIVLGSFMAIVLLLYVTMRLYIRRKMREMGLSTKADAGMYEKRYRGPVSRMTFVFFILLIFGVLFLLLLFFAFS